MQTQEPNPNDTTNETAKQSAKSACCGIYGLRNLLNDKWYVGRSKNVIKRRFVYSGVKCKGQPAIYNALMKYGYKSFVWCLLETCSPEELVNREDHWTTVKNSRWPNGYNVGEAKDGGDRRSGQKNTPEHNRRASISKMGHPVSEETKRKLSEKQKGKKQSSETTAKKIESMKKFYSSHTMTEEEKLRRSLSAKKMWERRKSISVMVTK